MPAVRGSERMDVSCSGRATPVWRTGAGFARPNRGSWTRWEHETNSYGE